MKNFIAGDQAARKPRAPVGKLGFAAMTGLAIGAASFAAAPAMAQSSRQNTTMQLIEMMHQNGSITDAQYNQLKTAAAQEVASAQSSTNTDASVTGKPSATSGYSTGNEPFRRQVQDQFDPMAWANKIKVKGDVRLRYEYNDNNDGLSTALGGTPDDEDDRSRGRLRYRLGLIATPIDSVEIGAGLASGGDDPRSTNQTFTDNFSSKGIQLDYAYAQYDFSRFLAGSYKAEAIGGKFKFGDYLWAPTDAMWDGDINPEGAALHLARESSIGESFLNGGVLVIQENSGSSRDPYTWYVQGGQHFEMNNFLASLAGSYYGFQKTYTGDDAPDTVFTYGSGTNTTSQFSVVDVNGSIGTKFDGGKALLIGEYLKNTHNEVSDDQGWAAGARVDWSQWAAKYLYVDLDRNVVPDSYPDSDRFNGATGIKGHEVALSYELNKAIELGVDYYHAETKFSDEKQNLVQTDVVFSF